MVARLPSLNGLRAFEAAARHLSFTNAAQELNVTQTAISHQIRRLEEELGLRLFERKNRSLVLTPKAAEYLPGIRAAFQDLRFATDRLLRKDDDKVLTISLMTSLATKWLLPRLSSFQEQHPDIDVRITTSSELVDFRRGDVDAAIRYGRGHWKDLRAIGEQEQRLYSLDAWRECPYYSERERAALAWTEAVTFITNGHAPDAVYEEAHAQFNEKELSDLTFAVTAINTWNRLSIASRTVPGTYRPVKTHPLEKGA